MTGSVPGIVEVFHVLFLLRKTIIVMGCSLVDVYLGKIISHLNFGPFVSISWLPCGEKLFMAMMRAEVGIFVFLGAKLKRKNTLQVL